MKGQRLLFGVCLGVLAFWGAAAMDSGDAVRAAVRGATTNSTLRTNSTRQTPQNTSRTNSTNTTSRDKGTTESRTTKNVASRTNTTVAPRTTANVTNRSLADTITRTPETARRATSTTARTATRQSGTQRIAGTRNARATKGTRTAHTLGRAATTESVNTPINIAKCRTIYYECMDEFCATKDTNLRRCACSSRANEFDGMQKQFDKFEEKMLDFNERLLTVNMDAADVTAINTATEGEDAFYTTKDKTKSKRTLDDIAKKLNTTFGEDVNGSGLGAVTWSLNADSAFDSVDSTTGVKTATKSGIALYNAAIPVCREIATEVCSDTELELATSGYQMQIEQDCNTVHKTYQTQVDKARAKVFESGALLDMSRLEAYQTRNSDDLLTCKAKMLDMLTDTTVCGKDMEKCLDVTGKYIDPTTGAAFLTANLSDLNNMITRPAAGQTWTATNANSAFLTYLKNKRKYLDTATENCVDIADSVWDAFIEDALSQIKLAQIAKLEEIHQACTTLTAECLTSASDSIDEFDARALSVFGVTADRTANAMCADVNTACGNLMAVVGDSDGNWTTGISDIATNKTYQTILDSCTQVGRNCIIESCHSISGNFGLCDSIDFSANRHSILERTACWSTVLNCVAAAGNDAILKIMTLLGKNPKDNFYTELYGTPLPDSIHDICEQDKYCGETADNATCATCRIAESIWGNCEALPTVTLGTSIEDTHNKIHIPTNGESTLLSWFAYNTGTMVAGSTTQSMARSCVNTRCNDQNYFMSWTGLPVCLPDEEINNTNKITTDKMYCPDSHHIISTENSNITNCCFADGNNWNQTYMGDSNKCCEGTVVDGICLPTTEYNVLIEHNNSKIVCVGSSSITSNVPQCNSGNGFPCGNQVQCNGTFIIVDSNGIHSEHQRDQTTTVTNGTQYTVTMGYYNDDKHNNIIPSDQEAYFIHYDQAQ